MKRKLGDWPLPTLFILLISALSYLLLARRFGFYNDDWYLAYAGKAGGIASFQEVFAGDRPFRAYFVGLIYALFGLKAPLYAYLAYALRVAGGLAMFWLLRLLWPRLGQLNLLLAVLFSIYPGWMDQPGAFDYSSHLLAFALLVFSLGLSVRALTVRRTAQAGLVVAAVACQVLALLLMEYYIGLEGLRLLVLLYLLWLGRDPRTAFQPGWPRRLLRALLAWLPYLAGAAGFLLWRLIFFQNTRAATDIGGMFSKLAGSPLMRGLTLLVMLVEDFISDTLLAWFVPFHLTTRDLRLRDALVAVGLGLLVMALLAAVLYALSRTRARTGQPQDGDPQDDSPADGLPMALIGALGVIAAAAPVVLGGRQVGFPEFSRFTLPASLGVIFLLGGLLQAYARPGLRLGLPVLLISLAVMTHYGNSVIYAERWQSMRDFWWQVTWRAPRIQPGTVLAAQYDNVGIPEDYYVWGPANLIYYPQAQRAGGYTLTPLSAVVLDPQSVLDIQLSRSGSDRLRRGLLSKIELSQVLVISAPSPGSCAQVLDGRALELSNLESDRIYRVAPRSSIDRVDASAAPARPPADLFGPQPPQRWCYYYEKAALARQQGNWQEVVRLGNEARAQKLHPLDLVEWMPFAQGYAYTGDYASLDFIALVLYDTPYLRDQACTLFTKDPRKYGQAFPEGQQRLVSAFCK